MHLTAARCVRAGGFAILGGCIASRLVFEPQFSSNKLSALHSEVVVVF